MPRRSGLRALIAKARDPVIILPYIGFGTRRRVTLCGRVLQDEGIRPAATADRRLRNLVAFFKRLESDEVPGARIRARCGAASAETTTDREGYFRFELAAYAGSVQLELVRDARVRATARVIVPSPRARFGVISDIDDTIVRSHVTRRARMLLTVALSNARTREPFPGTSAFYRALHARINPFFYVSKSPWNLYAPLVEYLELQGLPPGPLFLRDFGLRMKRDHKVEAIETILATYPRLPFVLIGDDGEEDPVIYADTARRHPGRIRAVFIRDVRAEGAPLRRFAAAAGAAAPRRPSRRAAR